MLQQNNQLPAMFADVRRGLAVAAVVEAATVTDSDGAVIDTTEFFGNGDGDDEEAMREALAAAVAEVEADSDEDAAESDEASDDEDTDAK